MAHQQPFLLPQQWYPPPQQQQTLFPNNADFQELAKAAAMRNNLHNSMAIPVRLANSSAEHTNSSTVVRSLVKRFDFEGKLVTVADNVRKWMEEDNPEWMIQIARRMAGTPKDGRAAFMLLYGDGYETLLLLDGIEPPQDLSKVPTIGISASFAPAVGDMDQATAAKQGLLEPSDSLWEHINFELNRQGNDRSLVLHTTSRVSVRSYEDILRKRVIRVWTSGPHKSILGRIERDAQLENKWKLGFFGPVSHAKIPAGALPLPPAKKTPVKKAASHAVPPPVVPPPAAANGAKAASSAPTLTTTKPHDTDAGDIDPNPIVLTFKPREIIVLERAFEGKSTEADRTLNCELWLDADYKAALDICAASGLRWSGIEVQKKRKSEGGDNDQAAKKHRGRPKGAKNKTPAKKPDAAAPPPAAKDKKDESAPAKKDATIKTESAEPSTAKSPAKEVEKPKETAKAAKPKETEQAKKSKETQKELKPKKKEDKTAIKMEEDDDPLISSTKETAAKSPAKKSEKSPDENTSSALKKKKDDDKKKDEKDDDEDDKQIKKENLAKKVEMKKSKSPGRPKGSKNKPKDEKSDKRSPSKAKGATKSKASDNKK